MVKAIEARRGVRIVFSFESWIAGNCPFDVGRRADGSPQACLGAAVYSGWPC
jgi:hypothetical protein